MHVEYPSPIQGAFRDRRISIKEGESMKGKKSRHIDTETLIKLFWILAEIVRSLSELVEKLKKLKDSKKLTKKLKKDVS